MSNYAYGIIRRLVGSGTSPEEDECHFDGWYSDRTLAKQIFTTWGADYPDHHVELIRSVMAKPSGVRFTDKDVKRIFKPDEKLWLV